MIKSLIFFIIVIIAFVAFTGIDVSEEYEAVSEIRDRALDDVIDPIVAKILMEASESELDEAVDEYIEMNYPGEQNG